MPMTEGPTWQNIELLSITFVAFKDLILLLDQNIKHFIKYKLLGTFPQITTICLSVQVNHIFIDEVKEA